MILSRSLYAGTAATVMVLPFLIAQDSSTIGRIPPVTSLQGGYHFLTTKVFSAQEDARILERFQGVRVADVSDGLDAVGLPNVGLIDPDIGPLWLNNEVCNHRFVGIAVTARYVPAQAVEATRRSDAEFHNWVNDWYENRSPEPFISVLRPGSVLVIDDGGGDLDVGSIDANSVLNWATRGCVGVVTNGGARDTDDIMAQKIPVYYKKPARGLRAGRNEIESVNRPVVVGGVCIMPGDVIIADGDGVVAVPRVHAERVALYAQRVREHDRQVRRQLYEQLALPQDVTVR